LAGEPAASTKGKRNSFGLRREQDLDQNSDARRLAGKESDQQREENIRSDVNVRGQRRLGKGKEEA